MKFIHRLGYYLGGFSIGLILLAFFLSGKKVSCDYGPEARVKKNIQSKPLKYSEIIQSQIGSGSIDSLDISTVLQQGDIVFSESEPRKEPCGVYKIKFEEKEIMVENCDSLVSILSYKK